MPVGSVGGVRRRNCIAFDITGRVAAGAPGDPKQWKTVDGQLYLKFNARAKELWEADQAATIERGQANWPNVLSHNQDR